MNHHKYERMISDDLDGALPERAGRRLAAHLTACPACRAYRARLEVIQARAASRQDAQVPPDYLDGFSARLRARLESPGAGERLPRRVSRVWRWAWLAAPVAAAAVFIFLHVLQESPTVIQELLTDEVNFSSISQAIDDNAELSGDLNAVILGSIQDEIGAVSPEEVPSFADDPAFWDNLSDDEAALIDQEISKELKS
jgi:anti-sigma factor RsiW